jgi:hypothetical protein
MRDEERDPHHALNNPVDNPDETEWPDPYEQRPDPRFDEEHPATGSESTSEPHPSQDPEAEPVHAAGRLVQCLARADAQVGAAWAELLHRGREVEAGALRLLRLAHEPTRRKLLGCKLDPVAHEPPLPRYQPSTPVAP